MRKLMVGSMWALLMRLKVHGKLPRSLSFLLSKQRFGRGRLDLAKTGIWRPKRSSSWGMIQFHFPGTLEQQTLG